MTASLGNPTYRWLCLFCAGYFLLMLLLGLDRHWSFKTSIYDTGVFDQVIWGSLNGKPFHDSIIFSKAMNWLGFHFHPILLLFVPLYYLAAAPEWLIVAQALAISSTAFPIYLTAIKLNYTDRQALLWASGFLLNPFVISAAIWDFHPVTLATPLVAMSILFLINDQFGKLLGCLSILLVCQEQMGLLVFCIGISYFLIQRHKLKSLAVMVGGLAFTYFLFAHWFPSMSPTGNHIMMTLEASSPNRYKWLGNTLFSVVSNVLLHPIAVAKLCLIEMSGYQYLLFLLFPFGTVLPLIGYELLVIGTADFAANILSLNPLPRLISSYHSITLIPVIIAAAMLGLKQIREIAAPRQLFRISGLLAISYAIFFAFAFPHLLGKESLWTLKPWPTKDPRLTEIQSMIPNNAAVSAQANIGAHFSQRLAVYTYPNKAMEADFVVLRIPEVAIPLKEKDTLFTHHMILPPREYTSSIRCLLHDNSHAVMYFNPPWLVFAKARSAQLTSEHIAAGSFLDELEASWQLENSRMKSNHCSWPT